MNVSTLAGLLLCDVINQSLNKKKIQKPAEDTAAQLACFARKLESNAAKFRVVV